ncbi:MAG: acetyl-CoA decarbonylase/synthase complex subunit gamma [Anaerolineae bacterium SM23_84]|nr:MAG: acetyl-CoA decarbonylase/synthase complex subunit gamma [Anaerolineae bacterium SM23_84]
MGLSGLQIYKLLPKTNCKECGFPTCLAFGMKLAAKQAELSACPYVSDEAKEALEAAAAPPIRLVTVGSGDRKVEVGNETVLFRHEKTFFHQPGLFVRLKDTMPLAEFEAAVEQISGYKVERVGIELSVDGIAVENASGDGANFANYVAAARSKADRPLVLIASEPASMASALEQTDGSAPLIYAAAADNWQAMADLAAKHNAPLAVRTDGDLSTLAELTEQIKGAGIENIVLDPGLRDLRGSLAALTQLRRLALKSNFRPLGYPIVAFPGEGADSPQDEAIQAAQHIAKYAGIVVLDHFDPATVYPLLTLRLNIYTDPQKPIQVSPGLYEISNPQTDSPLLVTTNFSLTYFSVAGEVEGSGKPTWLLVCDSEGMSVLTGWAAGKFDAEKIAKSVQQFGVPSKVSHKKIVIPGLVSTISGELEEELPGWEILVGPREAIHIPAYLRTWQ